VADNGLDLLSADLVALGRSVVTPEPDEAAVAAVLTRLPAQPASRPRRSRRRMALAAVVTAMLASLAAPPVRAEVAEWFGFGAVQVRLQPDDASEVTSAPPPPRAPAGMPLDDAAEQVAFSPVVPAALGQPDGVEVSADRSILSMTWDTDAGLVRVDQIDARLDYVMAKTASNVTYTEVAGDFALWFDRPHEVVVLDDAGDQLRVQARLAGHTLIWERVGVTLRLEGDLSLARAQEIAGSAEPIGNR
jgi:hypothetical protein